MQYFMCCLVGALFFLGFYNFILYGLIHFEDKFTKMQRTILRLLNVPIFIVFITVFLWGPWLSFCIDNIHKWNMNNLNDLEQKEKVLPAEEPVRESKEKEW